MAESLLNLMETKFTYLRGLINTSKYQKMKKIIPTYITIKQFKTNNKDSKAENKGTINLEEQGITVDFSPKAMLSRRQCSNFFNVVKENVNLEIIANKNVFQKKVIKYFFRHTKDERIHH